MDIIGSEIIRVGVLGHIVLIITQFSSSQLAMRRMVALVVHISSAKIDTLGCASAGEGKGSLNLTL